MTNIQLAVIINGISPKNKAIKTAAIIEDIHKTDVITCKINVNKAILFE